MSHLTLVLEVWGCALSSAAQESCTSLFYSIYIPSKKNTVKPCSVENVLIYFWEAEDAFLLACV